MSLISRKAIKKDKEVKFVGVHVPLQINSYLTLYAYTNRISKSQIINDLLEKWMNTNGVPIDSLLMELQKEIRTTYQTLKGKGTKSLLQYCGAIRKELLKKGIHPETVEIILKNVVNGEN